MNAPTTLPRNPGPSWGYGFLLLAERWLPRWFFRPLLLAGTGIAVAAMPFQRAHSRAYLAVILGRRVRWVDTWRHFQALTDSLLRELRAARGVPVHCTLAPENAAGFNALIASGKPALFGTFHYADSDLLGYLLSQLGRHVSILRQRVGNSTDTRLLGRQFAGVNFLWINNPADVLFDVKMAIEAGDSLAIKCDRLDFSPKTEPFRFLGASRLFPFTIYHLAALFDRPVVFCIATAAPGDRLDVFASPVFTPDPAAGRAANLQAGRIHFQAVLADLEARLRRQPFLWFNFLPLNPEVTASAPAAPAAAG